MTTATECKVFGLPIETKSLTQNNDGTLTIIGVASTTNPDMANEIVSPEVLQSLAKQAVGINIYRDHKRVYEGGIGATTKAWVEDDKLWIEATILSGLNECLLLKYSKLNIEFFFYLFNIHCNEIEKVKFFNVWCELYV